MDKTKNQKHEERYLQERYKEGYRVARRYQSKSGDSHYVLFHNDPDRPALLAVYLGDGHWSCWQAVA